MMYGLPLWYRLKGKGIKSLVNCLNKTQNIALHWITGAFHTTLVVLIEFFSGIAPVRVCLDFQLKDFLVCISTVPSSHPLCLMATQFPVHLTHATVWRQQRHASSENIMLLQLLIKDFNPFPLFLPLLRLGHRIADIFPHCLQLNVLPHPPKASALFEQWIIGWTQVTLDAISVTDFSIGMDTSFSG